MTSGRVQEEEITFLTAAGPNPGNSGVNLRATNELRRPFEDVLQEWRTLTSQINQLLTEAQKQAGEGPMRLSTMEVSIGLSVTGTLGIAEATAEASITLTFGDAAGV